MDWLAARLGEASTWNAIATFLAGMATYLGTNHYPAEAAWIAAVAAGASALAGFIIKEAPRT